MRFIDKVAIVTGAASGIGRKIALDLLNEGAKVIAFDLKVEELRQHIDCDKRENIILLQGDVCNRDDRLNILKNAEQFGSVDFLVNVAGIIKPVNIFEVTEDVWDQVLDVNAKSCFFMCQMLAKYWVECGKKGAIVNFSSSAAKTGHTSQIAPYSASKASVISITKSFAHHLAPYNIRVNCVCPGIIETPMQTLLINEISVNTGNDSEKVSENRLSRVPLNRIGTVDEVSNVVQFLLSDESSYMTGQSINITGGMVMY